MKVIKIIVGVIVITFVGFIALCLAVGDGLRTHGYFDKDDTLCFAVEVDDFDGNVYKAGVYAFIADADPNDFSETPIVWDVYKSDHVLTDSESLKDQHYVVSLGGYGHDSARIRLNPGDIVYIAGVGMYGIPVGDLTWTLEE